MEKCRKMKEKKRFQYIDREREGGEGRESKKEGK